MFANTHPISSRFVIRTFVLSLCLSCNEREIEQVLQLSSASSVFLTAVCSLLIHVLRQWVFCAAAAVLLCCGDVCDFCVAKKMLFICFFLWFSVVTSVIFFLSFSLSLAFHASPSLSAFALCLPFFLFHSYTLPLLPSVFRFGLRLAG